MDSVEIILLYCKYNVVMDSAELILLYCKYNVGMEGCVNHTWYNREEKHKSVRRQSAVKIIRQDLYKNKE